MEWLGNGRREDRLIFRKVGNDRGRYRPFRRRYNGLRRRRLAFGRIRTRALTLALILRNRFAGKDDRLISRRRSVIVIAADTRGCRCPLKLRVRPAASGTVAAAKPVAS